MMSAEPLKLSFRNTASPLMEMSPVAWVICCRLSLIKGCMYSVQLFSIWQSNMFGKSLYELVNEGLHTKLEHMPDDARAKISETLERIINEGSNGLICILL